MSDVTSGKVKTVEIVKDGTVTSVPYSSGLRPGISVHIPLLGSYFCDGSLGTLTLNRAKGNRRRRMCFDSMFSQKNNTKIIISEMRYQSAFYANDYFCINLV